MTGQRARTTAAFTIVEMLVVIGVLGLLLGILLPALSGANKRSLKHKELNSLRQIKLGRVEPWARDHDHSQVW